MTTTLSTQVIIVGAGPSGLMLGAMLHKAGIDHVLIERQSPDYVLGRIRAGVLEQVCTDFLDQLGVGQRMRQEGLRHDGIALIVNGAFHRIDLAQLTGGKHMTVYGQTEITRDLMGARTEWGLETIYSAQDVLISGFEGSTPSLKYTKNGVSYEIKASFIAGCDGFHGICRASVPSEKIQNFEKIYPFGWLGILTDTHPVYEEVTYCNSERGFALSSMRSLTRSRYYIQCRLDEQVENWSDDAFWTEFKQRIEPEAAKRLICGPSIEKSIAPLRSFVAEPMRFGSLFLAGDAAHIVPPTGAKGLNLAATDVLFLGEALIDYLATQSRLGIDHYSSRCLSRIWKAERFSWWFTQLMHQFPDSSGFGQRVQMAELDYLLHSESAQRSMAENYVGLPVT